jgi:hypothetical protein
MKEAHVARIDRPDLEPLPKQEDPSIRVKQAPYLVALGLKLKGKA